MSRFLQLAASQVTLCIEEAAHRDIRDEREAQGIEAAVDIEEVEALQYNFLQHLWLRLPHRHARQAAAAKN